MTSPYEDAGNPGQAAGSYSGQQRSSAGGPEGVPDSGQYRQPLAPAGQRPADPSSPSLQLSDDEIKRFRRLQAEDEERQAAATRAREEEEAARPVESHWLHLANGDVIRSAGVATHIRGIAVVGAYPITEEEEVA